MVHGTGQKPFSPDLNRGKWERPTDYIFASVGLALKLDVFDFTYYSHYDLGILGILIYFVYMIIYMVPIIFVHSFIGQFSSSGFISAFRLSPFFKGMGYVSVILSLSMLTYYSVYAAIPLLFIINSLRPTLPWSCEGLKSWFNETSGRLTICNWTISGEYSENQNYTAKRDLYVPSVLYFHNLYDSRRESGYPNIKDDYELSLYFVGLFALVWAAIAFIFYKFSETAKFGKFIRYMVIGTLILLLVCFVRFLFLPGGLSWMDRYATPKSSDWVNSFSSTFLIAMQAFGAGWGSVIALSSFNGFKTDIMSYSWIISFGQIFIYIMFGLVSFMVEHYFKELSKDLDKTEVINVWVMIWSSASALSTMSWPNLWTSMYYTTLLMAAVILITTQIFTVLQSLFDEFEELRVRKQEVTYGLIGGLALSSIFFCTNHGITFFCVFYADSIFSNSLLHLLLLLVVFWIYGRDRFQRDIEFMLGQPFASWKIFVLRYIAPILFVFSLPIGIDWSLHNHSWVSLEFHVMGIIVLWLPILAIPGLGLYYLSQSTGTFYDRFRRTCRPTNWYPVEMERRQNYEEAIGAPEMTHQLTDVLN
ncbi:LOW QUALITY PROTEIN: sodium- and chloride-dependent glycine transporter 1-like [Drosophila subpulchrella]|uniref:LOW QUALITY PROTEIN: sodium- and chloride-dependent glycine transporter 1-like n=1 Tax=Drosophila subpulchrella TaxID=1486046 RepID=UPI0018A1B5B4|nr:LOW QUALITY PROTEIN: sodium- and chloride-dependent glycine transporter 1-like [Drosophila subpulchrella]